MDVEVSNYNCGFVYSSFQLNPFLLTYFVAPLFDIYIFKIAVFSWYIDNFIIMLYIPLSLAIFFNLKFVIFDVNIAPRGFL